MRRRVKLESRADSSLSRRRFLGAASGTVGLGTLAGCEEIERPTPPQPDPVFRHGVASGDPLPGAVIVWTRVTPPADEAEVEVAWTMATDPGLGDVVKSGAFTANEDSDFTVKVDVTGLDAGTTYYYRFEALEQASPVGRTRTAPAAGASRLRFAVVSCASFGHGYFHAYRRVAERLDLDAVVHLGDYIYEYGDGEYGFSRAVEPIHEILTLDDYRARYAHYRADPDLQEAHRQHPFVTVWDDHEVANNSWGGGADNHDPAVEGSYADRRLAAARAYDEWMPIRIEEPGKIWRSLDFGGLATLYMLDTRMWGRDPQAADKDDPAVLEPERTLLGEDQEAWLAATMAGSGARFHVVAQQVMMAPLPVDALINTDQWDGYPAARERFYATLGRGPIENVVVLTGDIHTSWASDLIPEAAVATYDPRTGEGAVAVELVVPGVTSPGLGDLFVEIGAEIELDHPQFKLVELTKRGYLVLDITPERAQGAYYHLSQVEEAARPDEVFTRAVATYAGQNHLVDDGAAAPDGDAAPAAP